ncbi:hypothetical protein HD806DRAFT_304916 [Xylariaceae sp. AK1471]|nr:hypothetical protein HD806DRAFT_304916 [Xylariaceae sp. AK1471]
MSNFEREYKAEYSLLHFHAILVLLTPSIPDSQSSQPPSILTSIYPTLSSRSTMAIKALLLSALAALPVVQGQLLDPNWKGQGHVYVVEGSDWPWGPDDPSASTIGCLNANGKLTASDCAVFNANAQLESPTTAVCGWTPRGGAGAQPSVLNCASPTYYPIYRFNNQREPIYLVYGAGYLGWSVDSRPTGNEVVDVYNGGGWTQIKVDLLWTPL